jgi:restriction system protein
MGADTVRWGRCAAPKEVVYARYWVIAPYEAKNYEFFNTVWQFDQANNTISIGFGQLGDVSNMDRQTLSNKVAETFPGRKIAHMIWAFYHEISPGDIVLARRGRKILVGVGAVTRAAYYQPGGNPYLPPDDSHPNFIDVAWDDQPRNKEFSSIVFPMYALSEFSDTQYHNILEGSGIPPLLVEPDGIIEDQSAFVLESYLEDFIISNFNTIFSGSLVVFEEEASDGQQYTTDIGPIDILAVEPATKSFVVIELKKGRPSDQVVGQILRYMGWVKQKLCKEGQDVKGLVICREPDPRLSYALSMTCNVQLKYYSVSFKLRDAL